MTALYRDEEEALASRRAAMERLGPLDGAQRSEIAEIDKALARLVAGRYGVCEVCGRVIGRGRLRAVPEARRCLGCAEREHSASASADQEHPMKKILVAVDGSPAALHAAKQALELAGQLGAQVTAVHVAAPIVIPSEMPPPTVDLRAAALADGAAVLKAVAESLGDPNVQTRNLFGAPAELIADLAVNEDFDLVVVGNTGRGAVSRVLLGSVADRLVHICTRPVLVVR